MLWIQLFVAVMILFDGVDGLIEMEVDLGNNATISCSLRISGTVFWYKQHQAQSPVALLRSLSKVHAHYYNKDFKKKNALLMGERLLIKNVTAEDYLVYYCGKKEDFRMKFCNGTRLVQSRPPESTDPSVSQNRTVGTQLSNEGLCARLNLLQLSVVINAALLLLVVVGSFWICCLRKRPVSKGPNPPQPSDAPRADDGPEYEMIQLPPTAARRLHVQLTPVVYSEVQLSTVSQTQSYEMPDTTYTLASAPSI